MPTRAPLTPPQILPEDGPDARLQLGKHGEVLGIRRTGGGFRVVDPALDAGVRTIYGEGRGEGQAGMAAIAAVIANRADHWGRDYYDVVHEGDGSQFNAWKDQGAKLRKLDPGSYEYQRVLEATLPIFAGEAPDPTNGALEFFNPSNVPKGYDEGSGVMIANQRFRRGGWGEWHRRPRQPVPAARGAFDPSYGDAPPSPFARPQVPRR